MSIDLQYGNVSPARYPNPGRKRKSAKHPHPAGKKKKEKENETLVIQDMAPIGLEAFEKNEATYLGDMSSEDCDPVVREVVEDTRAAVDDMMKELKDMVDQATQTPYPPEYIVTNVYDKVEADSERKSLPSSVDTLVCPCRDVRLEARQSQKGWPYVKCPIQPCLLFCGQDQAPEYMKAVYSQPHLDVLDVWSCLQCFCREPAILQQSHSSQNPDRLYVTRSKKKCQFFRWADQPLGPKQADPQAEPPLSTRDAQRYPKRGVDIPGPPPRVRRKEDVERERPLTDYETQLLRDIQDLKNRHEVLVAPAPPKYSDSVENWQKGLETITYGRSGLF